MSNPSSISPGVRIGHDPFKAADQERALVFYVGGPGFERTQHYASDATFVSEGGYHHPIGLNAWESQNGSPPPTDSTVIFHFAKASDHGGSQSLYRRDPGEIGAELYWDCPEVKWPRTADGGIEIFLRLLDLASLLEETEP